MTRYTGIIDTWRDRLPLPAAAKPISLGEGNTPLIKLDNLLRLEGVEAELYVKFEGANPTGSFKDRGMTVAVTEAVHRGSKAILCASTGNTSAAAAAYAVRAGIQAFVLIPEGKIAMGKLAQAIVHGATVVQIRGNFDDGMRLVKEIAASTPISLVNSVNPYRLQGQKTASFEIVAALGRAPDVHCIPVGNAGNITAHWIGYSEAVGQGTAACLHCGGNCALCGSPLTPHASRPKMAGYQAAGAAPFLRGAAVKEPDTVATAIRIGDPQSWAPAWKVHEESGGWFDEIEDAEILSVQALLAKTEGVFCEPASAASLAGALRDLRSGRIAPGSTVVCTLTGNGLKDPDIILNRSGEPGGFEIIKLDADRAAVEKALVAKL